MIARTPLKREAKVADKFRDKRIAWEENPDILNTNHRFVFGDARVMPGLDHPVHLVVTSPPYWNLKRYEEADTVGQLGHVSDREEFLAELGKVWKRSFDLLVPGGRMCVVVGDVCRSRKRHGRHLVEPLHAFLQVQCQELGFDPLASIFWHKIANATTEVGGAGAFLGKPYEPNAVIKNDVEFILMFRKPGGYRKPTSLQRKLSLIDKDDYQRWFRQIWHDVRGESLRDHPAPFPVEIAKRLISMFSFVGDTVLDPFGGLGTTALAAAECHRSSVSFEIERTYFDRARHRLFGSDLRAHFEFVEEMSA